MPSAKTTLVCCMQSQVYRLQTRQRRAFHCTAGAGGLTDRTHIARVYFVERQIRSEDIFIAHGEDIEILGHQQKQQLFMRNVLIDKSIVS